jgi:tRNA A-37 threonylcarbamoyl transferase component Bud32
VYRTREGILKVPRDEHNEEAVAREMMALLRLKGLNIAPAVYRYDGDGLLQEDLGDTVKQPRDVAAAERLRREVAWMVAAMRSRALRHGDLTDRNWIMWADGSVKAIDFQEAHVIGIEDAPQKQPVSDSALALRVLSNVLNDENDTADTPRIARRWKAILDDLGAHKDLTLPLVGQTLYDFGTFQGDFCAWAAVEGMYAIGYDRGGFQSGVDSIEVGREIWSGFPFGHIDLRHGDIGQVLAEANLPHGDVGIIFSTWVYILHERGQLEAEAVLSRLLNLVDVLYFETQLYGDGPGWEGHRTGEDIAAHLVRIGGVPKAIATFPVTGRRNAELGEDVQAMRIVWRVTAA